MQIWPAKADIGGKRLRHRKLSEQLPGRAEDADAVGDGCHVKVAFRIHGHRIAQLQARQRRYEPSGAGQQVS